MLDAFLTCVARYGVDGATLERIAAEAGLKRPLIRHHLGNREDMIQALAEHVVEAFSEQTALFREALSDYPGLQVFVDALFSPDSTLDPRLNNAYQALIMSIADNPGLRDSLLSVMAKFYRLAIDIARTDAPEASESDCESVGQGIVDLYSMTESIAALKPPLEWRYASYNAAQRLASSLKA